MVKQSSSAQKIYILDTNVLLHDPQSLFNFAQEQVGIPIIVLEELDKFKRETSERGKNARETIRHLDELRKNGSLSEGVKLENGGTVRILFAPTDVAEKSALDLKSPDNIILFTALNCQKNGMDVRFITKDLNARVKADVLSIEAEDYLKSYVPRDEFYKGWIKLSVPAVQLKKDIPDDLITFAKNYNFLPNEYALVESQHNTFNYKIFRYIGGKTMFAPVVHPQLHWNLGARNPQQLMALDALFNPALEFVTLLGPAGTGKTFLALLAGLHQVIIDDLYRKMLISRPVVPLGPDIGFLPGDLQEKLHTWMQPVYDNLDVILHASTVNKHLKQLELEGKFIKDENSKPQEAPVIYEEKHDRHDKHDNRFDRFDKFEGKYEGKKSSKHNGKKDHKHTHNDQFGFQSVQDLVNKHKLSLEAITYMRGRSIPYQFILIDEVQNLSPHEVKTIVSRVGQGSKIILCGDPYQIDSPYLDFSSNGLVVSSDKFKGQDLFATVYLEHSERSVLSQLAGELM